MNNEIGMYEHMPEKKVFIKFFNNKNDNTISY